VLCDCYATLRSIGLTTAYVSMDTIKVYEVCSIFISIKSIVFSVFSIYDNSIALPLIDGLFSFLVWVPQSLKIVFLSLLENRLVSTLYSTDISGFDQICDYEGVERPRCHYCLFTIVDKSILSEKLLYKRPSSFIVVIDR
jgi:hypothetical protein